MDRSFGEARTMGSQRSHATEIPLSLYCVSAPLSRKFMVSVSLNCCSTVCKEHSALVLGQGGVGIHPVLKSPTSVFPHSVKWIWVVEPSCLSSFLIDLVVVRQRTEEKHGKDLHTHRLESSDSQEIQLGLS